MREPDMAPNTIDEEAIFKVACRITAADARDEYLQQICGATGRYRPASKNF